MPIDYNLDVEAYETIIEEMYKLRNLSAKLDEEKVANSLSIMPDTFITVYECMIGWKSVCMSFDPECECHVPWNTGYFAFATREEALPDARSWAEAEELPLLI